MEKIQSWKVEKRRFSPIAILAQSRLPAYGRLQLSEILGPGVLPRNLGEFFVLLLVEPIAGKKDKKLWRFLKNFLVAEKS